MNRRTFVVACGAAAAAPCLALTAEPAAPSPAVGNKLPALEGGFSSKAFETYRGELFRLSGTDTAHGRVRLRGVITESGPNRLEQFSLTFEPVQGEAPGADGLYLLEHPQGGRMVLALQPVWLDGRVRSLTASFSLIG